MTERSEPRQAPAPSINWRRGPVSIGVLFGVLALLLVFLPTTLLIVFAGLLLAILFRSCGVRIGRLLSIAPGWGVALFLLCLVLLLAGGGVAIAPAVLHQFDELWREVPAAVDSVMAWIKEYESGRRALEQLSPSDLWSFEAGGVATQAVGSVFGTLGNIVLLLFIALYGAADPGTYRQGFLKLIAPSGRADAKIVLARSVDTLQNWLVAQSIAMAVVGLLTGLGLWLIGIPLALVLGLIAGLLAFIPNVGPVLAAAPGLLLAVPQGMNTVLMVLGVYVTVQALESYVITPILQKQKVSLPPVLVIALQLAFATLFGLLGLALATPIAALSLQLTRDLYVTRYLERDTRAADEG
jgi:predicted PurR-regulated permease PerM